jgi:hypothetical protein
MLLLTIEDEDSIFPSLKTIGLFLSPPKKTVNFNTYIYQGKGIKLGVGTNFVFDKAVSTKSHNQTFSCQSSVMTKGKNLPLTYSQATALKLEV